MDPELYKAARSGDVNFLRRRRDDAALLVSQKTPKDSSILHIAAEFNQLEFFKQVVSLVPDSKSLLKHVNSTGDSALHLAAGEGAVEVGKFIISHLFSSDVEQGVAAAAGGDDSKELLRIVNEDGDNALHLAAQYGGYEVAKLLVEADPHLATFVNKQGQSACFMAMLRFNTAMVKLLLGLRNPRCSPHGDRNGMSILHAAVFYCSSAIKKKIVTGRPETIRMSDAIGWTPLHYASRSGSVSSVNIFLNCDPSSSYLVGNAGESPLHIAAFNGHISVMELLVNCRPDCWDVVTKKRQTALHAAVLGRQVDVVEYILGFPGLQSIARLADDDGNTALHLAAVCKSPHMIAVILSMNKGYDRSSLLQATNKQNLTAIGIYKEEVEDFFLMDDESVFGTKFLQERHEDAIGQVSKLGRDEHQLTTTMQHGEKKASESDLLKVTATLIATVTFTAGFTMPGGYEQSGDDKGMAVLASQAAFRAFMILDIISFFSAITLVYLQFSGVTDKQMRKKMPGHSADRLINASITCLFIAFLAMALAFTCGTYAVLVKSDNFGLASLILSISLAVICFYGVPLMMVPPKLCYYNLRRKVVKSRRYLSKILHKAVEYCISCTK